MKASIKEHLLQGAERYEKLALSYFTQEMATLTAVGSEDAFDRKSDELFVHFLFPNLSDFERNLLAVLRQFRRNVTLGVHVGPDELEAAERAGHERTLTEVEAQLVSLKEGVRTTGLEQKLTPAQREVLQQEFLTIHFRHR